MSRFARYVGTTVLSAVLLTLLTLVAIDAIASVIDELAEMSGSYDFTGVMGYILFQMPDRIYEYLPFACLIGCLIGLGLMAGNSELVVMRAAGVSVNRIVGYVLQPVLLIILLGLAAGEWLVPVAERAAESFKQTRLGEERSLDVTRGVWNREGREFIHINVIAPGGTLLGVSRYLFDENNELLEASHAREVRFRDDHWQSQQVRISRFSDDRVEVDEVEARAWNSQLTPELLDMVAVPPDVQPMSRLYRYWHYLEDQDQDAGPHQLAFWRKALQPLTITALMMVAISFVFGPLREVNMGYRIFTGVVVGITFRIVQDLLGPASLVYGFSPLYAVLIPVVVCFVGGFWLLRRAG